MPEQPDECSVIDLRIWGPPDAAGKVCGGVLCRPTWNLMQVSCKERDQVRWGQALIAAHPNPARNIECPTEEYG